MAEKRFTHKKWYNERRLFDGDEPFAIVDVYIQAEAICDKLNKLAEEKQRLKRVVGLCMTCKHRGYTETGCLCEYEDCWVEDIHKCENYKEY